MPLNKRRRVSSDDPLASIFVLPPELIHRILSFLPISTGVSLLQTIPTSHQFGTLLHRSIYERSVFYGNHYLQNMTRWGVHNASIKQLSSSELAGLINNEGDSNKCIIPKHFIFKYTYDFYSCSDYNQYEIMHNFTHRLSQSEKYFELIGDLEIQIDLCNKLPKDEFDNFEIGFLSKILRSPKIHHNLTKLHLKRFHRAVSNHDELAKLLEETLCSFVNLDHLLIDSNRIQNVHNLKIPRNITSLSLMNNKITSLPLNDPDFFPPNLLTLNLSCNDISNLKGVHFPDSLQFLDVQLNSLRKLSDISWPSNLRVLIVSGNELQLCEDKIELPVNLQILNLLQNPNIISFRGLKLPNTLRRIFIDVVFEKLPIDVPRKDSIIYA